MAVAGVELAGAAEPPEVPPALASAVAAGLATQAASSPSRIVYVLNALRIFFVAYEVS
jgi:hypothetical protein